MSSQGCVDIGRLRVGTVGVEWRREGLGGCEKYFIR
jgi:hypothetical protein